MVTKIDGPFHWHKHDDTDDFFLVLKSTLGRRDRRITPKPGEVCPRASSTGPVRGEVHIPLIEPTGTPNTGDKATAAPRILA